MLIVNCVLIFPAGTSEATAFAAQARRDGRRVIGASSLRNDPARGAFEHWIWLPYVHEPSFADQLSGAITDNGVTMVYSSHEVVRHHLSGLLPDLAPNVALAGASPRRVDPICPDPWYEALADAFEINATRRLKAPELAAVVARALAFRGESAIGKLIAMLGVAALLPPGDLVEIGVLSGRSAFVLGWAARRYQIGPVLVLDPWSQDAALQHDTPIVLQETTKSFNFNVFFDEFIDNLVPCFYQTLNYARAPAHDLCRDYGAGLVIGPTEFGVTSYAGRIALLHVDGNHDLRAVRQDVADWVPRVQRGGWVVIDDYVWAFGTGPRQVGDELLASGAFDSAFVCDGALFLKVAF